MTDGAGHLDATIVIPHVDRSSLLATTVERVRLAIAANGWSCEILIVCDGSGDAAWERARTLASELPEVEAILVAPRSWALNARAIGLSCARGSAIATLDDDLDIAPEEITRLLEAVLDGADLAAAVRTTSDDRPRTRRIGSAIIRLLATTVRGEPQDISCGMKAFSREHALRLLHRWPASRDIRFGFAMYDLAEHLVELEVEREPARAESNHDGRDRFVTLADAALALLSPARRFGRTRAVGLLAAIVVASTNWSPLPSAVRIALRVVGVGGLVAVALEAVASTRSPVPESIERWDGTTTRRYHRVEWRFEPAIRHGEGAGA